MKRRLLACEEHNLGLAFTHLLGIETYEKLFYNGVIVIKEKKRHITIKGRLIHSNVDNQYDVKITIKKRA